MAFSQYLMQGKRASGRLKTWLTDLPDRLGALAGEAVSDVVLAGGGFDMPDVTTTGQVTISGIGVTIAGAPCTMTPFPITISGVPVTIAGSPVVMTF